MMEVNWRGTSVKLTHDGVRLALIRAQEELSELKDDKTLEENIAVHDKIVNSLHEAYRIMLDEVSQLIQVKLCWYLRRRNI
jgi:isochorismate synthase EntC